MIRYTLSGRQRKEALQRNRKLVLALPLDGDDPPDPLAWARERLDLPPAHVNAARLGEVRIAPLGRAANPSNLTELLGQILADDIRAKFAVTALVVLATVCGGTPRGKTPGVHWPDNAMVDGARLID